MTFVTPTLSRLLARLRPPQLALAATIGAALLLALGSFLWPETFYYPVVWQYYYGPLVSDYAGEPLTRGGVTAYGGYNPVDTMTWAIVLGVCLWNLLDGFRRRDIKLTRALTYSLVPMIIAGGTMRGLIEIDWLPAPWAYFFITPNIYFVFFFYTLAALFLGFWIEGRTRGRFPHWYATLAAGTLAVAITWSAWGWYVLHPPAGAIRWIALWEIFGYSAILTALLVALTWKMKYARDSLYVLVLYGQIVDGMQNYIGISRGYTSKLMGPNFLSAIFGDAGLLVGKIVIIVPILAYMKAKVEPEQDDNTLQLILLAILALGLAMGFHGGVGLLLGF